MATRVELLNRQGRLIAEATSNLQFWDSAVRLEHLNTAYYVAQQRIREVAPHEFIKGATCNIVANQYLYQRPTYENVRRYDLKLSATDVYRELTYIESEQAVPAWRDAQTLTDGRARFDFAYSIVGKFVALYPTPTVSVTAGLRVIYAEAVQLTSATDTPRMPVALHHLLSYGGAIFCLEESKDAAEPIVDRYRQRWASVFGNADGSTEESRRNLKRYYALHQSRPIVGMSLA